MADSNDIPPQSSRVEQVSTTPSAQSVTGLSSTVSQKLDQINNHLARLAQYTEQLLSETQNQRRAVHDRQRTSRVFLRKMAMEVPPVVLAVLLAFGINSWWQQRKADQLAKQSLENIVNETQANLAIYERIVRMDERNLRRLERQIEQVQAGVIHPDTLYGQGINLFIMQEGAWQAATLTGAVEYYDQEVIQDASELYSRIHFRNVSHANFNELSGYKRYQEETLLPYLLENREVLADHMQGCSYEMGVVQQFLKKYGHRTD